MPVASFCQTGCANGCYQTNTLAFAFCQIISSGVLLSLCSYELHRLSFPLFPEWLIHPQNSLHLLGVKTVSKIFQFIVFLLILLFCGLLTPDTLGTSLLHRCPVRCLSVSPTDTRVSPYFQSHSFVWRPLHKFGWTRFPFFICSHGD